MARAMPRKPVLKSQGIGSEGWRKGGGEGWRRGGDFATLHGAVEDRTERGRMERGGEGRGGRTRGLRPHGAHGAMWWKNARAAAGRGAGRGARQKNARAAAARSARRKGRTFAARLDHGPTRPPPRWTQLDEGLAAYGPVASCLEASTSDPENSGPTPWGSFDAYRAIERQEALRRRRSRLRARGGIPLLRGVRAGRCSARRRAPRGRRGSHGAALPPTGGPRGRRTRQRPHPR